MKRIPREYLLLALVVVAAAIIGVVISLAGGGGVKGGTANAGADASSYTRGRDGLLALHDGLKLAGYSVQRYRLPLERLRQEGILIIAAPVQPLSRKERRSLLQWVKQGNTVILATSYWESFMAGAPFETLVPGSSTAQVPFGITPERIRATLPCEYTEGVRVVETRWGSRVSEREWSPFGLDGADGDDRAAMVPLFKLVHDTNGAVLAVCRLGRGKVFCLADPWVFSNRGLPASDNLRLVMNMLGPPSPARPVMFDEYHHGYRDSGEGTLFSLYTWLAFAQGLLALGVYIVFSARRFGEPLPPVRPPRERTEYVEAMAVLLRKGRSEQFALHVLGADFNRQLTRLLALAPGASAEAVAERAARKGVEEQRVLRLVRLARKPGSVQPGTLVQTVRQWRDLIADIRSRRVSPERMAAARDKGAKR